MLWRAVVLSSGGVILCWLLLMTLFLQWSNYRLSYVGVARDIARSIPVGQESCLDSNISPAQRASIAYLGKVRFARFGGEQCDFLLLRDEKGPGRSFRGKQWKLIWEGRRPADRTEHFRLYQREPEHAE